MQELFDEFKRQKQVYGLAVAATSTLSFCLLVGVFFIGGGYAIQHIINSLWPLYNKIDLLTAVLIWMLLIWLFKK